ncbi:MAG: FtsX-like permease family protein [Gammaproteobacteria bacterium]|nr:FtsX-like permease family protein [Gammaproteobacteria bacterium]MDE0452302.1 FtsX-like permease family protein [Gammaproteobacteria bacterium]
MSAIGLVWPNLGRKPVRTVLTLMSLLVAFVLFTYLRAIAVAFTSGGFGEAGIDRLVVSPKYSIIDPLPVNHQRSIATVPGVEAVTHADWFGGIYQEPRNFFPKFPVDPEGYFSIYSERVIAPEQLAAFRDTRTGAVVSAGLAERFGWKIGDRIPIEGDIYPKRDGSRLWEFDLVGIYRGQPDDPDPGVFLFQYDYFDEARQFGHGGVGWFIVRVGNPEKAAEIASAIDAMFENSINATRTATEDDSQREFAKQFGNIGLITTGILGAVFFTILLLTANTMAQALRDRIPELAVLKTFGFTDGTVGSLVLAEAILLCVAGGALGIGLAAGVQGFLSVYLEPVIGPIAVDWPIIAQGLALAVLLGAIVGLVPAFSAWRLTIVDALRERQA